MQMCQSTWAGQAGTVPITAIFPGVRETDRHVVWVEVPAARLAKSVAFFEEVLGVSIERPELLGVEVALLPVADTNDDTSSDVVHLAVHQPLTTALERVIDAGGEVLSALIDLSDGGHFAYCATPGGFRFGLTSKE